MLLEIIFSALESKSVNLAKCAVFIIKSVSEIIDKTKLNMRLVFDACFNSESNSNCSFLDVF
jgi:hypothetical protein